MDESVKESIKKALEDIKEYITESQKEISEQDDKLGSVASTAGFFGNVLYCIRNRADTTSFGSFVSKEDAEYVIGVQQRAKLLMGFATYLSDVVFQLLHEEETKQAETPPPTQRNESITGPKCSVCGIAGRLLENNRRHIYCGYCGSFHR